MEDRKGSALSLTLSVPLVFVPLALELDQRLISGVPLKSWVQREAERGCSLQVGRRRVAAPMLIPYHL